ncbi:hypothetical protein MKK88_13235 [Methylobacterium sp. E-005]|nr:hypothetical protein [Methylobacterium sp. E-005]MCJ2086945.1 hypothetical protein [Methylobacterium sp. E-005]
MLTAYLAHLQHTPAAIQVASCLLGSLGIFVACFAPCLIANHVSAYRASR